MITPILTIVNSYIEGIVRGYRNGLLTGANYSNLTQCETIDGQSPPTFLALRIMIPNVNRP